MTLRSDEFAVAAVFLLAVLAGGGGLTDLGLALVDLRPGRHNLGLRGFNLGLGIADVGPRPLGLGGGRLDLLEPLGVVNLGEHLAASDGVADIDDLRRASNPTPSPSVRPPRSSGAPPAAWLCEAGPLAGVGPP